MKAGRGRQRLIYCSLYYKRDLKTGANVRFDEIGRELSKLLRHRLTVITPRGEMPDWAKEIYVPINKKGDGLWSRITCMVKIWIVLARLPRSVLLSDFVPLVGVRALGHVRVQLIHDLRMFTKYKREKWLNKIFRWFQAAQLRVSRQVVCVSKFTKGELVKTVKVSPMRVIVSYNGLNDKFFSLVEEERYHGRRLLYVATFEERKNHKTLVRACGRLRKSTHVLFVGQDLGMQMEVQSLCSKVANENKLVEFEIKSEMSEEELIRAYDKTEVFVCPSLYEGFGIPLIEASARKCQIVCSWIPVFRELLGDSPIYVNPKSDRSIASGIEKCFTGDRGINKHCPSSDDIFKMFKWSQIACQLATELGLTQSSDRHGKKFMAINASVDRNGKTDEQ